jgi:hypothetical protein
MHQDGDLLPYTLVLCFAWNDPDFSFSPLFSLSTLLHIYRQTASSTPHSPCASVRTFGFPRHLFVYDLFTTLPDAHAQFFQIGYFLPSLCDEVRRHCVSLSLEGTTQRPLPLIWTSTAGNPITPLRICHPSSIKKKPPPSCAS